MPEELTWETVKPLIKKYESLGGLNVPNYRFDPGHTAEGIYQITHTNWHDYGPAAGVDIGKYTRPMNAPESEQEKVARYLFENTPKGLRNWEAPQLQAMARKTSDPEVAETVQIDLPDGTTADVPKEATPEQIKQFFNKQFGPGSEFQKKRQAAATPPAGLPPPVRAPLPTGLQQGSRGPSIQELVPTERARLQADQERAQQPWNRFGLDLMSLGAGLRPPAGFSPPPQGGYPGFGRAGTVAGKVAADPRAQAVGIAGVGTALGHPALGVEAGLGWLGLGRLRGLFGKGATETPPPPSYSPRPTGSTTDITGGISPQATRSATGTPGPVPTGTGMPQAPIPPEAPPPGLSGVQGRVPTPMTPGPVIQGTGMPPGPPPPAPPLPEGLSIRATGPRPEREVGPTPQGTGIPITPGPVAPPRGLTGQAQTPAGPVAAPGTKMGVQVGPSTISTPLGTLNIERGAQALRTAQEIEGATKPTVKEKPPAKEATPKSKAKSKLPQHLAMNEQDLSSIPAKAKDYQYRRALGQAAGLKYTPSEKTILAAAEEAPAVRERISNKLREAGLEMLS